MIRSERQAPKRCSQPIREQSQPRVKNMPQIPQRPRQDRRREQNPSCREQQRHSHTMVLQPPTSALDPSQNSRAAKATLTPLKSSYVKFHTRHPITTPANNVCKILSHVSQNGVLTRTRLSILRKPNGFQPRCTSATTGGGKGRAGVGGVIARAAVIDSPLRADEVGLAVSRAEEALLPIDAVRTLSSVSVAIVVVRDRIKISSKCVVKY